MVKRRRQADPCLAPPQRTLDIPDESCANVPLDPQILLREIAQCIGITERAAQSSVLELHAR
jgi:hypothetical protein